MRGSRKRPATTREAEDIDQDDHEQVEANAKRLVRDKKFRADTLERLAKWLGEDAIEADAMTLVGALPSTLFERPHPHHEASKCFARMVASARERLELIEEAWLMSSHFESTWADVDEATLRGECDNRSIAVNDGNFVRAVVVDERRRVLSQMTQPVLKRIASAVGLAWTARDRDVLAVAEALTDAPHKTQPTQVGLTPTPLPTTTYLEQLFADDDKLKQEFARLLELQHSQKEREDASSVLLFRAVAFARLYDWGVAELDDGAATKKTPVHWVHEKWASVCGLEQKSKRDRLLAIGRFVHRNPVLCFQSVLTRVSRHNGWQNGKAWTPLLFEAMLRDDKGAQSRCDQMRDRFRHLVFPEGMDAPTLRAIPLHLRGASRCAVMKSRCPDNSGDGLFAIADLPVGTSWLMGGQVVVGDGVRCDMEFQWSGQGAQVALPIGARESFHGDPMPAKDNGVIAWKANEPPGTVPPNACYLSSPEGVYLTVCRPISASAQHPEEVYVDYGDDFSRNYVRTTRYDGRCGLANSKEDWQLVLDAKALLAKSVHGIQPTRWHKGGQK